MQPHTSGLGPSSVPARVALAVLGTFAALIAVLFATRPDMVISMIRVAMSTP